jgi:hypothetical protein
MKRFARALFVTLCSVGSWTGVGLAAECGPVPSTTDSTDWDRGRAWIHESGWFTPLDRPKVVPAKDQKYNEDDPMLVVEVGGETRIYPVHAMAYHHVANDIIGGEPVVTTY